MAQYHNAPQTRRTGTELSLLYGYDSLRQCIDSIPKEAVVMDVGSGSSPFAREMAYQRSDVTFFNFDHAYHDLNYRDSLARRAPKNLQHVPLDIVSSDISNWRGVFDIGYSYWLIPHLSLEKDITPAQRASENILAMMKADGELRVGPKRGFLKVSKSFVEVDMAELKSSVDYQAAAARVVAKTRRNPFSRQLYLFLND